MVVSNVPSENIQYMKCRKRRNIKLQCLERIFYSVQEKSPDQRQDFFLITCIFYLKYSLSIFDSYIVAFVCTCVNLSWASDLLSILYHFLPLCYPSWKTANSKHNREHFCWYTYCFVNDTIVEINIRIQVTCFEVLIFKSYYF